MGSLRRGVRPASPRGRNSLAEKEAIPLPPGFRNPARARRRAGRRFRPPFRRVRRALVRDRPRPGRRRQGRAGRRARRAGRPGNAGCHDGPARGAV